MSKSEQPAADSSIVSSTPSGIVFRGRTTSLPPVDLPSPSPTGTPDARPAVSPVIDPPVPSWREWLRSRDASSLLISLALHAVLLALLAIPIARQLSQSSESATLIEVIDPVVGGDGLGEFIDAPELIAETARGSSDLDAPALDVPSIDSTFDSTAALAAPGPEGGSEDGTGTADVAGAVGGYLLREPGNAVKAGRFTAFSRPIITIGVGDKKREEFGEPGESPLEGQAYFIVIHIKVDPRRTTYPLGDLIGSVVGTDGYMQRVPDGMFVLDDDGNPVEVKRTKRIRVTNGVVQLLMRVKGAYSGVRDNIYLKSKMLREEQNLQLIFQARPRSGDPDDEK